MPDLFLTRRDRVAVVSLNRPAVRNAVTLAMWRELADIFSRLAGDDEVRAVVLTGSGTDFSVGADVSEFDRIRENRDQSAAYEVSVDACSAAIADVAKPVIAAISGYCLGGGCHLALACDFRFADHTAKLGIPSAKLSIIYGVKSVQRLLAIAGLANALPRESVELFNLARNCEHEKAFAIYRWFLPLLRMDTVPEFVQLIKLVQAEVGMGNPRVRPPRLELTGDSLAQVQRTIKAALLSRPELVNGRAVPAK